VPDRDARLPIVLAPSTSPRARFRSPIDCPRSTSSLSPLAPPPPPSRRRWCNQLNPMVKRGPFTEDEDRAILAAHAIHGNKWAVISRSIPGRYEPRTPRLRLTHPEHVLVVRPATLRQLRVTRRLVCQFFGPRAEIFPRNSPIPVYFFTTRRGLIPFWKGIFAFPRRGIQIPLLSQSERE